MRDVFAVFVFALALAAAACTRVEMPAPTAELAAAEPMIVDLGRTAALPRQAGDPYYVAAAEAVARKAQGRYVPPARNVILFIGDGMGVSTVTAARIYAGQKRGLDGESYALAMDQMPHLALSKTYSHDGQVSDSAATATAMVAGVKTNLRTLGVTAEARFGNCASLEGTTTETIFELAEAAGLATGIVSTARITHATPAAAYAKSPSRNWEDNTAFEQADAAGAAVAGCQDIATQLVDWPAGDGFEVAMGGGRRHFLTTDTADPEDAESTGTRTDGRDLAAAWTARSDQHRVIYGLAGFEATDFATNTRVLGLFEPSHLNYELDRPGDGLGEPSLAELTRAAITRLSRNEAGFVLMVEAGRIDHAHHGTNAARALEDTDAFDQAIATALDMTDASDTLIIVTADHSHTMTLAGYPRRNNPILGKVIYATGAVARGGDGLPYTTIGYANGPNAPCAMGPESCQRGDLTDINTAAPDFRQQALVPMPSETHAGEDVPIFASGPGASLVSGVMEQNEIFHVIGRATGLVAQPTPE